MARLGDIGARLWNGAQRQAAVVALRHACRHRARRPRHVDQHVSRLSALRHAAARQAGLRDAQAGRRMPADRLSQARRRSLPSTGCRPCFFSNTNHEEDQPVHLKVADPDAAEDHPSTTSMPSLGALLPGGGLRDGSRKAVQPRFQINAQNCVHCKTCDIKDPQPEHHLGSARGRRGPNYPNM